MTIRAATSADDRFILGFVERFSEFPLPSGRNHDSFNGGIRRDLQKHLRKRPPTSHFFVIEHDGERAGFVHLQEVDDFFGRGKFCHISDLAISPEHEGRGLARRLLNARRGIRARTWLRAIDPGRATGQRTRTRAVCELRIRDRHAEARQATPDKARTRRFRSWRVCRTLKRSPACVVARAASDLSQGFTGARPHRQKLSGYTGVQTVIDTV